MTARNVPPARIVVQLTDAQRGRIRSIVDVTIGAGEGNVAMRRGLDALDNGTPILSRAEFDALVAAQVAWQGDNMDAVGAHVDRQNEALERAMAKVRRAMT